VFVLALQLSGAGVVPIFATNAAIRQALTAQVATPAWTAYVPNEGSSSVTPINVATNTPGTAIPSVTRPFGVAITPDGRTAYVANTFANTVTPINVATNTAGTPIPVGMNPVEIAITPDGLTAYVVNNSSNDVTPINLANNSTGTAIPVGTAPYAVAITPNGASAYVANTTSNNLTPISLATNTTRATIPVGGSPQWISIAPDGSTAYVADGASNDVTPINLASDTAGTPIPVAGDPAAIAITPDGSTAYVSQFYAFTVTPINLKTNTLGTAIPIAGTHPDPGQAGPYPTGLEITPDGSTVYVTDDGSSAVTTIDVATNTLGTTIPVGSNPAHIAITPDQAPIAALSVTTAAAGSPSSFDASASTVALGTIAGYLWNFGDGSSAATTTPTTNHTYTAPGSYTASVTETDSAGTSIAQVFTGQTLLRNGGPSASISRSVAIFPPAWTAYVPNEGSNSVTPINLASNVPGTAIPGVTRPFGIAISPDGRTAYVANTSANTVTPINLITNTAGTPIPVGTNPIEIAITPDGTTAYVVNNGSNDVTPINLGTNSAGTAIPVGTAPYAIAITPNGASAYVANTTSNNVTPINLATNAPRTAVSVGNSPQWISITPDGSTAYVADGASSDLTPINLATETAGTPIPVAGDPAAIAITPDGSKAYVSQFYLSTVTPINLQTNTLGTAIPVGSYPTGLAISPDGSTAYVTNDGANSVTPIKVATNSAGSAIPVGGNPARIAITPDQAPVAALSVTPAPAGSPSSFNASASTVAVGTIAGYAWTFGDGSTATTSTPTTSHVYAAAGSYPASVTETDSAGTSTARVFTGQTVSRNGGPGASAASSVVVPLVTTFTSLSGSPTSVYQGDAVTLSATVSPTSATGTVNFEVGGVSIGSCSTQPLSSGTSACLTSSLAVGTDSVTAVYSGDPADAASTSNAVVVTVAARTAPPAPINVYAGVGGTGVNVTWTTQGDGGNPITGSIVTVSPGGQTFSGPDCCGANFDGSLLTIGATYTFTVQLTNSSGTGPSSAPSNPVTPSTINFKPSPPEDFGPVPDGSTSDPLIMSVYNNAATPANVGQLGISGTNAADFAISSDGCSNTAVQYSCQLVVTFKPTIVGQEVASLDMPNDGPVPVVSGILIGNGASAPAGYLSISPRSNGCCAPTLTQTVGTDSPAQVISLSDHGSAPLHVGSVALSDGSQGFRIDSDACSGQTLQPGGAACSVNLIFHPDFEGNFNDQLMIFSDAVNSNTGIGLNGIGFLPPTAAFAAAGDGQAQVAWTHNTQGVVYTITVSPGGASQSVQGQNMAQFQGLTNGTAYTFTVSAGGFSVTSNTVTPSPVQVQPLNLFFPEAPVGIPSRQTVALDNGPGSTDLHVSSVSITGPSASEFTLAFANCSGGVVYPGSQCRIDVTLNPTSSGQMLALLTVNDDGPGGGQSLVLSGEAFAGAPLPVMAPQQLLFSSPVGVASAPQTATVTNLGSAPVDWSQQPQGQLGIQGPNAGDYRVVATSCGGAPLAVNGSCTLTIVYTPSAVGNGFATVLIGADFPFGIQLNGLGYTAPAQLSGVLITPEDSAVTIGFNPPPQGPNAPPVTAFRVTPYAYGNPQAPVTIPNGAVTRITSLAKGTPYSVTVAAVNAAGGVDSAMSNVVVPGRSEVAVNRKPDPFTDLLSTWSTDSTHAWSVGGGGVIKATIDGGRTWATQVSGTTANLTGVVFTDSLHGLVVGGSPGVMLKTTDGGTTWVPVAVPTDANFSGISFADASHGLAVGGDCPVGGLCQPLIIATADSGATWTTRYQTGAGWIGTLNAVSFAHDGVHAWAVGDNGTILATADGGGHWVPQVAGATGGLEAVWFSDPLHGWAGGTACGGRICGGAVLATTNGGVTWTSQTLPANVPSLVGIDFVDNLHGFAVSRFANSPGISPSLIATVDGGVTWTVQAPPIEGHFQAVHFVNASRGWVVGQQGLTETTANGGSSWTVQGLASLLQRVSFTDNVNGWAVGTQGTILRTANGGASWVVQTSNSGGQLAGVKFLDSLHGWAVGSGGVYATTDGGTTWTNPAVLDLQLNGVSLVDATHGWAVGNGGVIFMTSDGTTWTQENVPAAVGLDLNDVTFLDAGHGWAIGDGTVLATTDGLNWTARASLPGVMLQGLTFVDALHGWVVGSGGAIYATADGGSTWTAQSSGTIGRLFDVKFLNPSVGFVGGVNGLLLSTIDGGAHWVERVTSPVFQRHGLGVLPNGHVVSVGGGGLILTYSLTAAVAPKSLTFLGPGSQAVTLTAAGTGTLHVAPVVVSGPNAGDFSLATDGCSGRSVPGGTNCGVSVAFHPTGVGPETASLVFADDAASTPQTVSLVGRTAPGAPANVTATAGNGTATVRWTAPPNGGSPITSYVVTASPGVATMTVTTTSATFSGLTNGTTYTFQVAAANAIGSGPAATSNAVTPKANQTITFAPLPNRTLSQSPFTLSATASSGLTVIFTATGVCTVSGSTVTLTGKGVCSVTAHQAGDNAWNPAPNLARSFRVS
jgi:YVTN family beta-propeller protein